MRERVLIHKQLGELFLLTNKTADLVLLFTVLRHKFGFVVLWDDDDFIDLGEL